MLAQNGRQLRTDPDGLSFKMPDTWIDFPGVGAIILACSLIATGQILKKSSEWVIGSLTTLFGRLAKSPH